MTTAAAADEFVSYSETFFRESDHVIALIRTLQTDANAVTEIERTLSKYQEQPHLLDSHLSTMIDILFDKSHNAPPQSLSTAAWRVAYALMRVRGAKIVWKFLPHDVRLLVPLLDFVESPSDDWHARYVALYWLAVLVLVPFRFHVIAESHTDIDLRVRAILQCRLADAGPTREAGAFLAAQWIARGDSLASMTDFLHWCIANVADVTVDEHLRCGVLRALANVCRFAPRAIVENVADRLLGVALAANETATDSQRLLLKVIQRATLALMPLAGAGADSGVRVRRLFASAPSDERAVSGGESATNVVEAELPAQLEAVLDILIRNVASQTGSARWMAAKGIARLCARLPAQLVVEVSEAALFGGGDGVGDGDRPAALHGACLLLAELLRRGVLPAQLRERALREIAARGVVCDQRRAAASVGSAARDAAAYAMWAAARAIPPSAMAPLLVSVIAPSMAVMAVCDREVNCRRAAAAALQENIGRHGGSFPNGIAIVTLLDFYAVGNATSCARSLLPQLAALVPSFFDALLAHLVERMSRHWHVEQRTLCADAVGLMAQLRPDALVATAAPVLVERARKAPDFVDRHGALLALACICSAIAGNGEALPNCVSAVPASCEHATALLSLCEALPGECAHPAAMRAPGAPLVVGAAARLAGAVAALDRRGATPVVDEFRRNELVSVARVALSSNDADCRNAGAAAVESLIALASDSERTLIAQSFVAQLEDARTLTDAQCGACIVLGALPASCFADVACVFGAVRALTTLDRADCAVRAQACAALGALMTRHFATREQVVSADALIAESLGALNRATLDRTVDAHGDVGAQVREAALAALAAFAKRWLADSDATLGAASLQCVRQFATELPEHCFDRINRGRAAACVHFSELAALRASPLPNAEPAVRAIVAAEADSNGWSAVAYAVPLFVPLVVCDSLARSTLRGIATSLVGATRSLAEQVQSTLEAYLPSLNNRDFSMLCNGLTAALTGTLDTRTRPAFWRLSTLVLELTPTAHMEIAAPLCDALCANVVSEFGRARTFASARSSLPVLGAIAQQRASEAVRRRALQQLTIFLACSWPVIRRETAELLLDKVLVGDDSAAALLRSTAWDSETLEQVRTVRNELCAALKIPAPCAVPRRP